MSLLSCIISGLLEEIQTMGFWFQILGGMGLEGLCSAVQGLVLSGAQSLRPAGRFLITDVMTVGVAQG